MESKEASEQLGEADRLRRQTTSSWSIGQSRFMIAIAVAAALYDLASGGSTLARVGSFAWCALVAVVVVVQYRRTRVQPTRRQWWLQLAVWLAATALINAFVFGLEHYVSAFVALAASAVLLSAAWSGVSRLRNA